MYFNQNEIGKRVRDLRRCRGLTIEKLSEELNYSHSHMSKAELRCEPWDCCADVSTAGPGFEPFRHTGSAADR